MTYEEVKPSDKNTESEYVTFDSFFLKDLNGDGVADAIRGTCNEVGKQYALYFELRVLNNGYLKDGVITIEGDKSDKIILKSLVVNMKKNVLIYQKIF